MVVAEIAGPFIKRHPATEGWEVRRLSHSMATRSAPLIPLFIRKSPDTVEILKEQCFFNLRFERGQRMRRKLLSMPPFTSRTDGLSDEGFEGEIHVKYKGHEIRFLAFRFGGRYSEDDAAFVATKSRDALEGFWADLRAFQRNFEIETITIWGEANIPRGRHSWDDLVLPQAKKADLRCMVESFMGAGEKYREMGLPWRRGLLFGGPPGCGKSTAIRTIASQVKASIWVLPINAKTSDSDLSHFLRGASESAPAVCVIEDLDRVGETTKELSMSNLLNQLDGIGTGRDQGILLISTANHVDRLDPALSPKRPGRYDRYFLFDLPTLEERAAILHLRGKRCFSEETIAEAAAMTKGYTHAMVQELVVNALLKGINQGHAPTGRDLLDGIGSMRGEHKAVERQTGVLPRSESIGFAAIACDSARST